MLKGEKKKEFDELVSGFQYPDAIRYAIELLFPQIKENISFAKRAASAADRRISHPQFAENYFALNPDGIFWKKSDLNDALLRSDPIGVLQVLFDTLGRTPSSKQEDVKKTFLDTLFGLLEKKKLDSRAWFIALISNSKLLLTREDASNRQFFGISFRDQLRIFLAQLLEALSPNLRASVLREAIRSADDLSLIAVTLRSIFGDAVPDGAKRSSFGSSFAENQIATFRSLLVKRIRTAVKSKQFWSQLWPGDILWFWHNAGHQGEVKRFTSSTMRSSPGRTGLMEASISTVISSGGNYETVQVRQWGELVNLERLEDIAETQILSEDETERNLAGRFIVALKRGEDGF